jgi:hypothetical protein
MSRSIHTHEERLLELREEIRRAQTMTPELMADVLVRARLQGQQRSATARVIRLAESGASVDAAFALLELELPQWKLRRLIYEDGEWALLIVETRRPSRRGRRHGRRQPRKPAVGDAERIRRSAE